MYKYRFRNKFICFKFDNVMRPACDICKSAVHILRNAFLVSDTPATFVKEKRRRIKKCIWSLPMVFFFLTELWMNTSKERRHVPNWLPCSFIEICFYHCYKFYFQFFISAVSKSVLLMHIETDFWKILHLLLSSKFWRSTICMCYWS